MRREIIIDGVRTVLDHIHEGISMNMIERECKEVKKVFKRSNERIEKSEICTDRLKDYIKLIQITGISEDQLFENKKDFYDFLEEYFPELWADIERFLMATGKNLTEYLLCD